MLPAIYSDLAGEPGPAMLLAALALLGTVETPGAASSPVIMGWAHELGLSEASYPGDEVPWCGLFMGKVALDAGQARPPVLLRAHSWAGFGVEQKVAMLGDVLVFERQGGGHVALYIGEDNSAYHVLGGNQGDAVTITRIAKDRCIAVRRAVYAGDQPDNIRRIVRSPAGALSTNEA